MVHPYQADCGSALEPQATTVPEEGWQNASSTAFQKLNIIESSISRVAETALVKPRDGNF